MRSQVFQRESADEGMNMSELQAHHLHHTRRVKLALVQCECHKQLIGIKILTSDFQNISGS